MTNFPKQVTFLSDDSEIKFVEEITNPKIKERIATYVFTKSHSNLGKEFPMFLAQLEKLEQSKLILCQ